MYVKKFASLCQVLKKMHTQENWLTFFCLTVYMCVNCSCVWSPTAWSRCVWSLVHSTSTGRSARFISRTCRSPSIAKHLGSRQQCCCCCCWRTPASQLSSNHSHHSSLPQSYIPRLKRGFCWCKVILPACPCWCCQYQSSDWLWRPPPKWPILCQVGR